MDRAVSHNNINNYKFNISINNNCATDSADGTDGNKDDDERATQKVIDEAERQDSDDDVGFSSDSNSLDDDILRSMDAFSSSDSGEDRGGVFYLDADHDANNNAS